MEEFRYFNDHEIHAVKTGVSMASKGLAMGEHCPYTNNENLAYFWRKGVDYFDMFGNKTKNNE